MSVRESGRQDRTATAIRHEYGEDAWVRVKHGDAYATVGDPDIYGCVFGRAFGFEQKNDEGKLTKIQTYRLKEMERAGAIVAGIRTPDDALRALKRGLEGR